MSWSGSFRNESFEGPGAYQAKNGVRCFIDMRTTPGPVNVLAPPSPEDHASFIISWDNPGREFLSFSSPEDFEALLSLEHQVVPAVVVKFLKGTAAFSFLNGVWEVFDWSLFGVAMNTNFAIAWTGRNTNGLCTIIGEYKGVEVERTSKGFYTVRLFPGVLISPTLLINTPAAVGLPAETSPELRAEDVGMADPDEILINAGTRNKNGQFNDDDLVQDPSNFMALIGQRFP